MERKPISLEDPLAALEVKFIEEFLALAGVSRASVDRLPPMEAERVLSAACEYASLRLAEIQARAHYVDEMHCDS